MVGTETMAARRGTTEPRLLAAGPGRLTQALGLTGEHDGLPLDRPPFELYAAGDTTIAVGTRVGITKAAEVPWRYGEAGSPYLSRPISPRPRS
jgi:DNA-3-methyladenine glycosylase